MERTAEILLSNRILIKNENDRSFSFDNLTKNKVLSFFNCRNIEITVTNSISKIFLTNCDDVVLNVNKVYTGIEIVYCKNLCINVVYSPTIQMDMSSTIKINTNTIIEMFIIYCMCHTMSVRYFHEGSEYKNDLWDDFFSRQIITVIDPLEPRSFLTTAILTQN